MSHQSFHIASTRLKSAQAQHPPPKTNNSFPTLSLSCSFSAPLVPKPPHRETRLSVAVRDGASLPRTPSSVHLRVNCHLKQMFNILFTSSLEASAGSAQEGGLCAKLHSPFSRGHGLRCVVCSPRSSAVLCHDLRGPVPTFYFSVPCKNENELDTKLRTRTQTQLQTIRPQKHARVRHFGESLALGRANFPSLCDQSL